MKIIIAILVTLFIAQLTPVQAQINNQTQVETQRVAVAEVAPKKEEPEPTPVIEAVHVQEQTIQQAEANVILNPVGCANYRHLVEQYDWDIRIAMAVMQAESGCNPEASNWNDRHSTCTGSFGLFQLGCFWTSNPYDPATNVAKAYEIYTRSGWRPWGAYNNGSYQRYL